VTYSEKCEGKAKIYLAKKVPKFIKLVESKGKYFVQVKTSDKKDIG
jgi:hypothetical protein